MEPDRWQACYMLNEEIPKNAEDAGYFAIGPWEPVTAFSLGEYVAILWRRPLRRANTTMDSPNLVR